jgi:hypothetical protein
MELEFDWDEGNIGRIARHGVNPEEVEQAIRNHPLDLGAQPWMAKAGSLVSA